MTHDAVLVFSKTWGAVYMLIVFIVAVVWIYWPSKRKAYEEAAQWPLQEEDKPWE